jgi:hypothetical protein
MLFMSNLKFIYSYLSRYIKKFTRAKLELRMGKTSNSYILAPPPHEDVITVRGSRGTQYQRETLWIYTHTDSCAQCSPL